MSRSQWKARERVALKNTRDGVVERNLATGNDHSISKREADFNLRAAGVTPDVVSDNGKSVPKRGQSARSFVQEKAMPTAEKHQTDVTVDGEQRREQRSVTYAMDTGRSAQGDNGTDYMPTQNSAFAPIPPQSAGPAQATRARATRTPLPAQAAKSDGTRQNPKEQPNKTAVNTPAEGNVNILTDNKSPPEKQPPHVNPPHNTTFNPDIPVIGRSIKSENTITDRDITADKPSVISSLKPEKASADSAFNTGKKPSTLKADRGSKLKFDFEDATQSSVPPITTTVVKLNAAKANEANAVDVNSGYEISAGESQNEATSVGTDKNCAANAVDTDAVDNGQNGVDEPVAQSAQSDPLSSDSTVPVKMRSDIHSTSQQSIPKKIMNDISTGNLVKSPSVAKTTTETPFTESPVGSNQFSQSNTPPAIPQGKYTRRLDKAQKKADKAGEKLEKARSKLPKKRRLRSERVIDAKTGKVHRHLYFEREVKNQSQHVKGPLPLRPVKAAGNTLIAFGHRKLFQVEDENVGTKAAHRAEMTAEGGVRAALRMNKTARYRKVAKLERLAKKRNINMNFQKALAQNPRLRRNPIARTLQKLKIKRKYAKAVRDAQQAAIRAKNSASVMARASKALASIFKRHPVAVISVVIAALIVFAIFSIVGAFSSIASGNFGGILTASYLAESVDLDITDLAYSQMETNLQTIIDNIETTYSGYDEYHYSVGDISHNPYELLAYLTVARQNFTYSSVETELQALFAEQYTLTITPSIDIRTRPNGTTYSVHVLSTSLTARSFSDIALSRLSGDGFAHYALLLQTRGSRQYLENPFSFCWLTNVTSNYGNRTHPVTGANDFHRGIDIAVAAGTEILAGQDGTVTFAGYSGDFGNVVVIENATGLSSKYAHCASLLVTTGQTVTTGAAIATVGNTGSTSGTYLHLEVIKSGEYLNPLLFVETGGAGLLPEYGIPGLPMGDGSYMALMTVAESHLGKPYVFGAKGPDAFDCSGFVCATLTNSGVRSIATNAQGIYNACTPISPADAQPGDLVFFQGTYSTVNTVTHVGIYVGGSPRRMIHAGNPIQYSSIDTPYWIDHFYSFGRI